MLPNVRKLFIPDPGYYIVDVDLSSADAQVVAWDAGDEPLKRRFREGLAIHAENAKEMFGDLAGPDGRQEPYYKQNKVAVHATNYGASARTLALTLGWSLDFAQRWQDRWFELHPAIKEWHERVEMELQLKRKVRNAFGFECVYWDRPDQLLPQALGWIGQSTVAIVCNKGALRLRREFPWVQILFTVHDSLVFQLPGSKLSYLADIQRVLRVPVPYEDPLLIQWTAKLSNRSWGEVHPMEEL